MKLHRRTVLVLATAGAASVATTALAQATQGVTDTEILIQDLSGSLAAIGCSGAAT